MDIRLYREIYEELGEIPLVDLHTHLRWDKPQAQSLSDIVFYHFVSYELLSAGMPRDALEIADEEEKLRRALPYFPLIRNTGSFYCLERILRDLYGLDGDCISERTLPELISKVSETSRSDSWVREVLLKEARIRRSFVNILPYDDFTERAKTENSLSRYAELFVPVIENGNIVSAKSSLILKEISARSRIKITDSTSLREAVRRYLKPDEFDCIKAFLSWASIDFTYQSPSHADSIIKKALSGEPTTKEEDNALWGFALASLLEVLSEKGIPFQFFFGSIVPRPGTPAIPAYNPQTFRSLSLLLSDHPSNKFDLFIGDILYSQDSVVCTKMHPNLHIAGVWWHSMYPVYIRRLLEERLDVCPLNKVSAFFSDAYCIEWSYGKWKLFQREFAGVLAERVEKGYITRNDASSIARRWMWNNPVGFYQLED